MRSISFNGEEYMI